MCGRFGLFAELDALAEQFNFDPLIMQDMLQSALEHPPYGAGADGAPVARRAESRQKHRKAAPMGNDGWLEQKRVEGEPSALQRSR